MKIRELTISARAKTCLLAAGYEDIEELESITDEELLNIRNLNSCFSFFYPITQVY